MRGSVPQERSRAALRAGSPSNLGVDEPAEMPDVVRGDRDDIASTDRKEGLSRKDGVSLERLVRRGGLAASPDDCPQLGSAVERGLRYRVEFEPHPDRVEPTEARDLAGPDQFATQLVVGDRRHDHPHLRRQKVTNPLLACQGFRRPLGIRENPERSGIEEDEPHEPNRGRSDNRSSLTARARYANVSRCSSSSPMSSSESRACNARAARWSISSGDRGNARPLASKERGGDVNLGCATGEVGNRISPGKPHVRGNAVKHFTLLVDQPKSRAPFSSALSWPLG